MATIDVPAEVWSCEWSKVNPFEIYCGTKAGSVCFYDIRRQNQPVQVVELGTSQPVNSLQTFQGTSRTN